MDITHSFEGFPVITCFAFKMYVFGPTQLACVVKICQNIFVPTEAVLHYPIACSVEKKNCENSQQGHLFQISFIVAQEIVCVIYCIAWLLGICSTAGILYQIFILLFVNDSISDQILLLRFYNRLIQDQSTNLFIITF